MTAEKNWSPFGRILSFQFWNEPNVLNLNLWVGPGPEQVRQRLLETIRANAPDIFMMPSNTEGNPHPLLIYHRPILGREVYDKLTREQREQEIRRHWTEFIQDDLPRIQAALRKERWIWEDRGT